MKKLLSSVLAIALSLAFIVTSIPAASVLANSQKSTCTTTIKSGWSLVGLGDLLCVALKVSSPDGTISDYPTYLDFYAYNDGKYVHARVSRDEIQNRQLEESFGPAFMDYANARVQKISGGQYNDAEAFFGTIVEANIEKNDTPTIEKYARYTNQEALKSLWVYNPGNTFSVSNSAALADDNSFIINGINVGLGRSGDNEYYELANFLQKEIITPLRKMTSSSYNNSVSATQAKGMLSYSKKIASGEMALDAGWNFLTYSPVIDVNMGQNGTCNITKAYVFDNGAKKWVSLGSANKSFAGNGMVVYNSNDSCYIQLQGELVKKLSNLFSSTGSSGVAPSMPPALP